MPTRTPEGRRRSQDTGSSGSSSEVFCHDTVRGGTRDREDSRPPVHGGTGKVVVVVVETRLSTVRLTFTRTNTGMRMDTGLSDRDGLERDSLYSSKRSRP